MSSAYEKLARAGGIEGLRRAGEFFMPDGSVERTLRNITTRLDELGISYAIVGGMALVSHGYERTTVDVDLLVTEIGLKKIHESLDGLGYVPPFPGSKYLRDAETGVRIEFLVAGQFPGDGKPKPVAFPDPASSFVEIDGIKVLAIEKLVELKLASGMTNPGRLKDLADVQELIRWAKLDEAFAHKLNEFVRAKFLELFHAVQADQSDQNGE